MDKRLDLADQPRQLSRVTGVMPVDPLQVPDQAACGSSDLCIRWSKVRIAFRFAFLFGVRWLVRSEMPREAGRVELTERRPWACVGVRHIVSPPSVVGLELYAHVVVFVPN